MRAWLLGAVFSVGAIASTLHATERLPWFGNLYEIEVRGAYGYSGYPRLKPESGLQQPHKSNNSLTSLSVGGSPFERWSFELEALTAATTKNSWNFASARATARYMYMDDVIGDFVSVVFGGGLLFPLPRSLKDPSLEYHGDIELEAHVSVGKEIACGREWIARAWFVGGIVASNKGAPWVFGEAAAEVRLGGSYVARAFARSTSSLGGRALDLTVPFKGYGAVQYRASDVGFRFSKEFWLCGTVSLEYSYRPYAHNAPEGMHSASLTYLYPFSF